MRADGMRVLGALSLAALSATFTSSCAAPPQPIADAQPSIRSRVAVPSRHMAQLDFGRPAAFASCVPPTCPAITPKTLAIARPDPPPRQRPVEPVAVSDRGPAPRAETGFDREAHGP